MRWKFIGGYDAPDPRIKVAKVPGGWLVAIAAEPSSLTSTKIGGITFLLDPQHQWNGQSLP
jgi:hypothetical protein